MQRDHVFLRGSVYHCRFVYVDYPELQDKYGLKERKSSLRTKNRAEAEALAAPHIAAHKLDILGIKNLRGERHPDGSLTRRVKVAGFGYLYPLGDYIREDGVRVIAEKHKALLILDGRVVGEEPNELRIVPTFRFDPGAEADKPRRVVGKNPDDEIIETWKADRATTKHISREGDRAWVLFKEITGNKPLKHCTREDGRKLAKTLFEQGKRRATVQKYLNHLNSAVNIAIEDGKFKGTNPFSRVLPKRRKGEVSDELAREPFDDDDMRLVRVNLHAFQPDEQLLWCILATTGMRRGEAWHIQEGEG